MPISSAAAGTGAVRGAAAVPNSRRKLGPMAPNFVLAALTLLPIVGYAFAYTYLLNKTGSVLLCVVLHACFNVAMASAGLRAAQALQRWDYILLLGLSAATIWLGSPCSSS
jgi:membrane protease YdiL (CAAX protease family)